MESNITSIHDTVWNSGVPSFVQVRIPVPSNIRIEFFRKELRDYADKRIVDYLEYGFPIGQSGIFYSTTWPQNHKGAVSFPEVIDSYIDQEKSHNAIIGPFTSNPFKVPLALSPLNSVEKNDSSERRIILDLSFPKGNSINEGISPNHHMGEDIKIRYCKVDDLVNLVKIKGQNCLLFKRDLKRAYRQIPVDPGDLHLLGWTWKGKIYIDCVLPMGLRSSAMMCQRVTDAIRHIMMKNHGVFVVNYLDDFAGCENMNSAWLAYEQLKTVLKPCGIEESAKKACPPDTKMVFLGIELNKSELTLSIPSKKVEEIASLLAKWKYRRSTNRRDLESLIGKLNFVATCVRAGRIFISRLLNFLRAMPRDVVMHILDDVKKDIKWWQKFMPTYNAKSMMQLEEWSEPDQILASDACLQGCGGMAKDGEFFHAEFPEFIQRQCLHINALEMLSLIIALKLWAPRFRGKRLMILCDNNTSVQVLNRGVTKDSFL